MPSVNVTSTKSAANSARSDRKGLPPRGGRPLSMARTAATGSPPRSYRPQPDAGQRRGRESVRAVAPCFTRSPSRGRGAYIRLHLPLLEAGNLQTTSTERLQPPLHGNVGAV